MVRIIGKAVLVTGANRGIGEALVAEAVRMGAERVYAGMRTIATAADARITPLRLDVTDPAEIDRAVDMIESLDVLINNAGIAIYDDLTDRSILDQHLAVNLFGTYNVTNAFLPLLSRSRGAIVNNLSVNAFAPFPLIPSYSLSKAAAFNMTQSMRSLLAKRGVTVHAVMTGIVDTDMSRGVDIQKASPGSVAKAILHGVERGDDEIFPDAMSEPMAASWNSGSGKSLERQYSALADTARS